jgi:hypothetical protein
MAVTPSSAQAAETAPTTAAPAPAPAPASASEAVDDEDDDQVMLPSAWQEALDGDFNDGDDGGDGASAPPAAPPPTAPSAAAAAPASVAPVASVSKDKDEDEDEDEEEGAAEGAAEAEAEAEAEAADWIDEPLAEGEVIEVQVEDEATGDLSWQPAEVIEIFHAEDRRTGSGGGGEFFFAQVDGDPDMVEEYGPEDEGREWRRPAPAAAAAVIVALRAAKRRYAETRAAFGATRSAPAKFGTAKGTMKVEEPSADMGARDLGARDLGARDATKPPAPSLIRDATKPPAPSANAAAKSPAPQAITSASSQARSLTFGIKTT